LLREPISSLKRSDIYVLTKVGCDGDSIAKAQGLKNRLSTINKDAVIFTSSYIPNALYDISDGKVISMSEIDGKNIALVCAIADPESFEDGVKALGIRLCILRTGVVLGKSGGMLRRLLPVFGLGLGGRLGSGEQWISWIALGDLLEIIRTLLKDARHEGVFNAVAPRPVSNSEFTAVLAHALGRPAFLHIPASVLKLAMGDMSTLLLGSQRAVPTRLLEARFRFESRTLEDALRNELG